jgi:hypothetical protein
MHSRVPRLPAAGVALALIVSAAAVPAQSTSGTVRAVADSSTVITSPYRALTPYPIGAAASTRARVLLAPATAIDLRPSIAALDLPIRNQGSRGTCSVHAMTFLLEYVYTKHKNVPYRNLSEEYLNTAANLAANNKGDGDFFGNIAAGYTKYGVVTERALPYKSAYDPYLVLPSTLLASGQQVTRLTPVWIKTWDPSNGASAAAHEATLDLLRAGYPVAVGMWWPVKSAFALDTIGGIPVMRDVGKAKLFDGHSVALVGFQKDVSFPGGGYFILRNSWGSGWDAGYGYVSFDYIRKYANDLVAYQ